MYGSLIFQVSIACGWKPDISTKKTALVAVLFSKPLLHPKILGPPPSPSGDGAHEIFLILIGIRNPA